MHCVKQPITVGVVLDQQSPYGRDVWLGAIRYALEAGWRLVVQSAREMEAQDDWENWKNRTIHGFLLHVAGRGSVKLAHLGLPVVNVSSTLPNQVGVPTVCMDNHAVGRVVAEHLRTQSLSHFAYLGDSHKYYSEVRGQGFVDALARVGHRCAILVSNHSRQISDWVAGLPKPVGILACNDKQAVTLLNACQAAGVAVRGHVALVGVDNVAEICESASPRLTSVAQQSERIGLEAARMLDVLMRGVGRGQRPARPANLFLPPHSVVVRESSILGEIDPEMAEAMKLIRDHVGDLRGVDDLVERLALTRRTLERRFQAVLGCSPLEEIRRVRIGLTRKMLVETNLTIAQIARQCGFSSARRMAMVFRQVIGTTPTTYRQAMRDQPAHE